MKIALAKDTLSFRHTGLRLFTVSTYGAGTWTINAEVQALVYRRMLTIGLGVHRILPFIVLRTCCIGRKAACKMHDETDGSDRKVNKQNKGPSGRLGEIQTTEHNK